MTLAELRTAVRYIMKQFQTDVGTLLDSGNTVVDFFINWAAEEVVLDLVGFMPEAFLKYEDISLTANTADYNLTQEFIQIWSMNKNTADKSPIPITYIAFDEEAYHQYVGETAEKPGTFTLVGDTIKFIPTPSTNKTNYARCWLIVPEAAAIVTAGPTYIPRMAQKLIPLKAGILIHTMNESNSVDNMGRLYGMMLERVTDLYAYRVQSQPRFLKPSWLEKKLITTLDPALYDIYSLFE